MQHSHKRSRFTRLAWAYGWTDTEAAEMKERLSKHPEEAGRLWRNLAVLMDAGYRQEEGSVPVSLRTWCVQRGWPDPHISDFSGEGGRQAEEIANFYRKLRSK